MTTAAPSGQQATGGLTEFGNDWPITFVVPGLPVGKGRPKIVKIAGHSRMATPTKTVAYEGLVAHTARQSMGSRPPLEGACSVTLFIAMPVPQSWSEKRKRMALAGEIFPTVKPDKDNVIKAVYDGMNGVVWHDDVQVVDGQQRKRYARIPCVMVEVRSLVDPVQQEIAA